jgi:hypothetical protein
LKHAFTHHLDDLTAGTNLRARSIKTLRTAVRLPSRFRAETTIVSSWRIAASVLVIDSGGLESSGSSSVFTGPPSRVLANLKL